MKKILLSLSLLSLAYQANAQSGINYEVSFPNAIHHEAEISMMVSDLPAGPLKFRMSRSSPGRYATHEFGKNVYNVKAFDATGKALPVLRTAGDEYEVTKPGKSVTVSYTLYGNWIDGTYAGFDETHAHMNIPATFMWPVGLDSRSRTVKFNVADKENWKVVSQLKPSGNGVFTAPNFQYFMDSPTEISNGKTASWQVKSPSGKTQTIHVVTHSSDEQPVIDGFAEMVKKVVDEQVAVWSELPTFDYGNYYFIHDVHPQYAGDGMEHRNSTIIVQRTPKVEGNESNLLGTFSHEFFHAWNVERFRPKTLEPFNFTHSNMSNELWMAEGFTQYYGNLILKRAGFRTLEQCLQTFSGLINTALNSPGARDYSPIDASNYAVFADAGVAVDQTNQSNIFTSYYTYGASVALALELRLRAEFNLTLDDYMRALWAAHGRPENAYTVADLEKVLGDLTKNKTFATDFFKQYIYGTAKNDYAALMLKAGFVVSKASPGKAWSGISRLNFTDGKGSIGSNTLKGTPAYLAGLDIDDVIISIDGVEIKDQKSLTDLMDKLKPGTTVPVVYTHVDAQKTTKMTLVESPFLQVLPIEKTGGKLTAEMEKLRNSWLESQIKN